MTTTVAAQRLTAADRCDRCGAGACVRVVLLSGGELMFCGHHARQHLDAVRPVAARIDDETQRIGSEKAGLR